MDWQNFLRWEHASRDTIDFKKIYVDLAGDLAAGLLLSQILYWHLPDKQGRTRLRVKHQGFYWLVKARWEWWDEIRLSPRQVDRAVEVLRQRGLVETKVRRFNGKPTIHLRLCYDLFLQALETTQNNRVENPFSPFGDNGGENPLEADLPENEPDELTTEEIRVEKRDHESVKTESPNGENGNHESVNPLTESTSENTTENTHDLHAHARVGFVSESIPEEKRAGEDVLESSQAPEAEPPEEPKLSLPQRQELEFLQRVYPEKYGRPGETRPRPKKATAPVPEPTRNPDTLEPPPPPEPTDAARQLHDQACLLANAYLNRSGKHVGTETLQFLRKQLEETPLTETHIETLRALLAQAPREQLQERDLCQAARLAAAHGDGLAAFVEAGEAAFATKHYLAYAKAWMEGHSTAGASSAGSVWQEVLKQHGPGKFFDLPRQLADALAEPELLRVPDRAVAKFLADEWFNEVSQFTAWLPEVERARDALTRRAKEEEKSTDGKD